jgi:hypothetical protein
LRKRTNGKVTAKNSVTKRKIHLFFTENKKRVISTNFREKSATPAMGTGTWQQQPSANGCQVPVPWQGGLEGLDDAAAGAG